MYARDPPPAPTVFISITGIFMGIPLTTVCEVRRIPPSHRETSVEVPPMSNDIIFFIPVSFDTSDAPITPPAGPERMQLTAFRLAFPVEALPPLDCIMLILFVPRPSSSEVIYLDITGETYALTTVVLNLSYSRYSGNILQEAETCIPDCCSPFITASSFAGFL